MDLVSGQTHIFNNSMNFKDIFIKIAPENPVLWTGMKGLILKFEKTFPSKDKCSANLDLLVLALKEIE